MNQLKQAPVDRVRSIAAALMLLAATSVIVLLLAVGWMVYLLVTGRETIAPIIGLVVVSPWIAANVVIFQGALQMADLQNYRLALWASVLSLLPFPGPPLCFPAGPLFGGIAIFLLLRPSVKEAFRKAEQEPSTAFGDGMRSPMPRVITRMFLMLLVIASVAAVALLTSASWWPGSSRVAWAVVALVESIVVHLVVNRTVFREGLDPVVVVDEGADDEASLSVGKVLGVTASAILMGCLVAAVAALAAGAHRSEPTLESASIALLVSIGVLPSPFVAPFLFGGGDGADGGDDGD